MFNKAVVPHPRNVVGDIYPTEDYELEPGVTESDYEPRTAPAHGVPTLWKDATAVRDIAADETIMYSVQMTSPGNAAGQILVPTLIIPECGNNVRRRAVIIAIGQPIAITENPESQILVTVNALTYLPNAFHISASLFYEHTASSAVYAMPRGAAASTSVVSVLIDQYRPEPK